MNPLRNVGESISGWVKSNVVGEGVAREEGTVTRTSDEYVPVHKEARQIKENLDRLEAEAKKIDKDISRIADTSQIKPPSIADVSDKELLIIGTTGGAAVGGAVSMTGEVLDAMLDKPKVVIAETDKVIQRPVMKGYDHHTAQKVDGEGALQGVQHSFTPRIEYENVGKYTEKTGQVVHTADVDNPVLSGLKGMLIGGGIGAAISGAIALGRKILHKGQYVPREEREIEGQGKVIAATAAAGGIGGAGMGAIAAAMESGNAVSKEISFKAPVMEKANLGQVPQNAYVSTYDIYRESQLPRQDVVMDSPRMEDKLLGGQKPVLEKVTNTVEATPRFGALGQIVGGALLGIMGGTCVGILVNTLRKIL